MKVLSYLQFVLYEFYPESLEAYMIALGIWNTDFVAHKKRTEYLSNYDLYNIAQANYLDWCSQPFKPEMITEYFEGWHTKLYESELKPQLEQHLQYGDRIHFFYQTQLTWTDSILWYSDGLIYGEHVRHPLRTLDDFINDCQRAGIELEGRQQ